MSYTISSSKNEVLRHYFLFNLINYVNYFMKIYTISYKFKNSDKYSTILVNKINKISFLS